MKIVIVSLYLSNPAFAAQQSEKKLKLIVMPFFSRHFQIHKDKEFFSGMALGIYLPGHSIKTYYKGTVSRDKGAASIDRNSLFEVGSITKSFTAVKMLQIMASSVNNLSLDSKLGSYFPEYSHWRNLSIRQLLNMTSGLPNYTSSPAINFYIEKNKPHRFSSKELINSVTSSAKVYPPMTSEFFYTNTGYILASMIIEKVGNKPFNEQLVYDILKPLQLNDTFYPVPSAEQMPEVKKRLVDSYPYKIYLYPKLVGKKGQKGELSWVGAAGGVVSNPEQIIKWVKEIFIENKVVSQEQLKLMTQLVSLNSGKPITKVSESDSAGYGLGLAQFYSKDVKNITWAYQGVTAGSRAVYLYTPCNGIILAVTVNSSPDEENNSIMEFISGLNKKLVEAYPQFQCKK
ncbi:MAG: beta-lactamase family protein [Tatlockia sp.]|nr:beta-lactamase family protein [Tatlockia sp.]